MANTKASRSAEGIAGMRAIETLKPEADRIISDPYARALIPGGIMFSISRWIIKSGLYELIAPGAVAFIIGRERCIDDYLKACLSAGFDTRAYRIPGIERTRVFEIGLNTQQLGEVLRSGGYDEQGRTLFIWQGVIYFLKPEGVDSTLAFIAHHSGPDSAVIFDYIYNETLHDTTQGYGKALARAGKVSGEPYVFGIDKGQVGPFLAQRGFWDVLDTPLEDV